MQKKRKRRIKRLKSTLRRPFPLTKVYDKKIYENIGVHPKPVSMKELNFYADDYRRRGYNVRIYEKKWGYGLYARPK